VKFDGSMMEGSNSFPMVQPKVGAKSVSALTGSDNSPRCRSVFDELSLLQTRKFKVGANI
jgi:hypothetical protein